MVYLLFCHVTHTVSNNVHIFQIQVAGAGKEQISVRQWIQWQVIKEQVGFRQWIQWQVTKEHVGVRQWIQRQVIKEQVGVRQWIHWQVIKEQVGVRQWIQMPVMKGWTSCSMMPACYAVYIWDWAHNLWTSHCTILPSIVYTPYVMIRTPRCKFPLSPSSNH